MRAPKRCKITAVSERACPEASSGGSETLTAT